jgi:hypothetical protein
MASLQNLMIAKTAIIFGCTLTKRMVVINSTGASSALVSKIRI